MVNNDIQMWPPTYRTTINQSQISHSSNYFKLSHQDGSHFEMISCVFHIWNMNNFSHNMGRMVVEIIYCEIIIGLLAILSSIMKRYIMHKYTHVVSHNMWVPQVYRAHELWDVRCIHLLYDTFFPLLLHFSLHHYHDFSLSPSTSLFISSWT